MYVIRLMFRLCCSAGSLLLLAVSLAQAQKTIHVPADAATIQGAIGSASPGDTILVAAGTYQERIDFQGKAITVEGESAASTILDGGAGTGAVVKFVSGEGRGSVLSHITVENGSPATVPDAGGILIYKASPTISNTIIQNNQGCGIGAFNSSPLIQSNLIQGTLPGSMPCSPLAKDDPGSPTGPAPATVDPAQGSAILLAGLPAGGQAEIVGNGIQDNVAHGSAAGVYLSDAGVPLVENNVISENQSDFSAAIWSAGDTAPTIIQNLIFDNTSDSTSIVNALGDQFSAVTVDNFQGLYPVVTVIANNTIGNNQTIVASGTVNSQPGVPINFGTQLQVLGDIGLFDIANNILFGDGPLPTLGCNPNSAGSVSPPIVKNNDVIAPVNIAPFADDCSARAGVNGNLSLDPMFVNTDATAENPFQLSLQSPAVDAGMNSAPDLPSEDILGNPRIQNAKGLASAIIDMGVYEYAGVPAPVTPADFNLAIDPSSLLLHTGQAGTVSVTVTPNASFAGGVSLSCAGLPATLTCQFAPAIVSIAQGTPGTATLTVAEVSPAASAASRLRGSGGRMALVIPGLLFFGLLLAGPRRQRAHRRAFLALVGFAALPFAVSACGTTIIPGTLQTSQTVVVTGAAGTGQLVRTASLQVSVQ